MPPERFELSSSVLETENVAVTPRELFLITKYLNQYNQLNY